MPWTTLELEILQTTSRVSSAFSLAGAGFIIITFCTSSHFHRPINRLAFFASFGNIMTNVATITSRGGILAGTDSALCQAQAVIIQWAIPADALFCLAMAWNVYLTVFKKRTTQQLRTLEPYYIVGCYGVPLVLAIILLFVRVPGKPRIYGSATLWCWIEGSHWGYLRIAAFYGPVWIVLTVTCFIYAIAGRVIFNLRKTLRRFAKDHPTSTTGSRSVPPFEMKLKNVAPPQAVHLSPRDPEALNEFQSYSCRITADTAASAPASATVVGGRRYNSAVEANTAAWAYCRCAMLFFLALFITWLPSSINRVYTLRYPEATDFGYNFAAVLVLPCQGFWNGLIYVVTTLPACKLYFRTIGRKLVAAWDWAKKKTSGDERERQRREDIGKARDIGGAVSLDSEVGMIIGAR